MERYKGKDILSFSDRFNSDEACYEYLSDMKWGTGYSCSKCNHKEYYTGRKWYYRRCTKCNYDESATSGTMFHNLKFPIKKAFHILFRLSTSKKGLSTIELGREYALQQKTCWLFKRKAQEAMKSSGNNLLEGVVQVDEFVIGGPEEEKQGRSNGKKRKVIVAVEMIKVGEKDKIGRAYAQIIDDYSEESIRPFIETHIQKGAIIETDGFSTYKAMKKDYKIEQYYSDKGRAFPELHFHIMNIQGWLRGIHHHCSGEYLQKYLDEFHFRFNRRNSLNSIFNSIISGFMLAMPLTLNAIREYNT